ncbi:MAG: hypothetical protein B7Y31_02590 [Novosphingobium sp. 16-62-11]|nr:MAG: hypothetical protein B7Y31_02590 [Novosphingobium sp. 16-62-11]
MLGQRARLDISVAKDRNPEYVMLSDGHIRNAYTLKLRNMEARPRTFTVALEGLEGGAMFTDEMDAAAAKRVLTIEVPADTTKPVRVYAVRPRGAKPAEFAFVLNATDKEGGADRSETTFTTAEGNGQ